MNHQILKAVIYDAHETIRSLEIVPRDYHFVENVNYILIGLRRAGKSTLLFKLIQEMVNNGINWDQIIYINFEDERLAEFTLADFNDIVATASEMILMRYRMLPAGNDSHAGWQIQMSMST